MKLKVSKKKDRSTDSDSDEYSPGSDVEARGKPKTSTKKGATKRNVRGRGAGNPTRQGRGNPPRRARGQSSSSTALADPRNPIGASNDDVNLSYLVTSMASITRPTRDRHDPPMVNYKRGGNSIEHLRYSEDPTVVERSFFGDAHFWFPHQADWYESIIMTKKHVTTEMKWIDWDYLKRLASLVKEVVDAVVDRR